jgi:hypothetical protein
MNYNLLLEIFFLMNYNLLLEIFFLTGFYVAMMSLACFCPLPLFSVLYLLGLFSSLQFVVWNILILLTLTP